MKIFAIVLVAAFVASSHGFTKEQKEKFAVYKKECMESVAVTAEFVEKSKKEGFSEDPKFKEYTFCVAKKAGFINEAGEYQVDVIKTKLTEAYGEEAEKIVKICTKETYGTPVENGYHLSKCLHEHCDKDHKDHEHKA